MKTVFGMNPPPSVKASIRRIKRKFGRKFYRQVIKAKKVVMKYNKRTVPLYYMPYAALQPLTSKDSLKKNGNGH